jgi:hypothetical protein
VERMPEERTVKKVFKKTPKEEGLLEREEGDV